MRLSRCFAVCLIAGALSACGGDDDDGDGDGGGFETARDLTEGLSQALCEMLDACGDLGDTSVADCVEQLVNAVCSDPQVDCDTPIPDTVSDAEINQCLGDIAEQACTEADLPPSCDFMP